MVVKQVSDCHEDQESPDKKKEQKILIFLTEENFKGLPKLSRELKKLFLQYMFQSIVSNVLFLISVTI